MERVEHALGLTGLLLVALTAWAADRVQGRSRIDALLARLVLASITAVGWAIDWLPVPNREGTASCGTRKAESSMRAPGEAWRPRAVR